MIGGSATVSNAIISGGNIIGEGVVSSGFSGDYAVGFFTTNNGGSGGANVITGQCNLGTTDTNEYDWLFGGAFGFEQITTSTLWKIHGPGGDLSLNSSGLLSANGCSWSNSVATNSLSPTNSGLNYSISTSSNIVITITNKAATNLWYADFEVNTTVASTSSIVIATNGFNPAGFAVGAGTNMQLYVWFDKGVFSSQNGLVAAYFTPGYNAIFTNATHAVFALTHLQTQQFVELETETTPSLTRRGLLGPVVGVWQFQ